MVVIVLTACPAGLRGYLTRWLLEISPGVFTGHVGNRVRELLWDRTTTMVRDGRAIMVFSARNEQRLLFKVHRHEWIPTDFDGVHLMMRPATVGSSGDDESASSVRPGWSSQSHWRRSAGRYSRSK